MWRSVVEGREATVEVSCSLFSAAALSLILQEQVH